MPVPRRGRPAMLMLALALASVVLLAVLAAPAAAERVEEPSLRTATSNTYRVGPQRFVTRVFAAPVNFRDASGAWRRIDETLVRSERPGYALRTAATPYRLDLPRTLAAGPVHFASGREWVTFELVAAGGGRVSTRGAGARYPGALPGVDVRYDAVSSGVKETLVLSQRGRRRAYRFRLATSFGLTPRVAPSGRVDFVRDDGSVAFHFVAPYMEDAAGELSRSVRVALDRGLQSWDMTLRPDPAWLRAPGRAWPVRLDPTIQVPTLDECAYIRSGTTADVCEGLDFVADGGSGGGGNNVKRPLMRFDVDNVPFASAIVNATLKLYHSDSGGTISLHQVTKPWDLDATWFSYDGVNPWSNPGGDYVSAAAASGSTPYQWTSWNITALTQLWVDGLQPNNGLIILTPAGESHVFSTSRRAGQAPYIDVTYVTETVAPIMGEPEHTPPPPTGWVDNVSLSVKGSATDVGVGLQRMTLTTPRPAGPFPTPKYFCDITQPSTCEATDATKCGGTWTSRCPLTGSKTFAYTTGPLSEGIVSPNLRAFDAAANESAAKSWTLKVDHTPPVIDEVSGSLWDRRNQTADHRFEGLYDPSYSVRFRAHDGTDAAPRSGMKLMRFEVVDAGGAVRQTQTRPGSCTSSGCGFAMDETFTFNTDSVPDGTYTIRLTAEDQLAPAQNHSSTRSWQVTVDRRGDIYTARDYDRAPSAGGTAQGLERVQLATRNARRELTDVIGTRRVVTCSWDSSRTCAEVRRLRLRSDDPPGPGQSRLWTRFGTSADDARLTRVATVLDVIPGATLVGTGDLAGAMQPWQTAPPAHGPTYELLDATQTVQEDGQTIQVRRRRWVDARTKLPVRELVTSGSATDVEVLFSYDVNRREASELPADTFAVEPADPNTPRSVRDYHTDPPPADPPPPAGEESVSYEEASSFRSQRALNTDEAFVRATLTDVSLKPSIATWGIPLTAAELAELATRDAAADAMWQIDEWAATNAPTEYAGAWLDHAAGGLVRVGFTANAAQRLPALQQFFPYPARLRTFDAQQSAARLKTLYATVSTDIPTLRAAGLDVSGVYEDLPANVIKVSVPVPTAAQQQVLTTRYGSGVVLEQGPHGQDFESRLRVTRRVPPMIAGLRILPEVGIACTSGFNMRGTLGRIRILTAGHCADDLTEKFLGYGAVELGDVSASRPRGKLVHDGEEFGYDAAQIAPDHPSWLTPHVYVNPGQPDALLRVRGQTEYHRVPIGKDVCAVGFNHTQPRCGQLRSKRYSVPVGNDHLRGMIMFRQPKERQVEKGDSGGAVYNPNTMNAVGIVQGGTPSMVWVTPIYTIYWAWGTRAITG